jgi:hypothetical protein
MVIFSMGADPEPRYAVWHIDAKCAIPETDATRPDVLDLFEMKRRMPRIGFE